MALKANPKPAAKSSSPATDKESPGERIAKVLSRAGVASRREAERMIELGQVTVNGKVIDSPALNVTAKDRITVNGVPVAEPEPPRLWLYYKPEGLVTSASDEKGRATVFDRLPETMPRVMSIGRLDLNSEGLLLLTNDGGLKRRLELPSTGWLRKYRVRINGNPTDDDLEPLRKGITVDGERFLPMTVVLDRIQGANAWLTVALREGKNREIRRALSAINLTVNRLIRVSYGPFRLGDLEPGGVEEVRGKVLRDQLGEGPTADDDRPARKPTAKPTGKPGGKATDDPASHTPGKPQRVRTSSTSKSARGTPEPGDGLRQLSQAWRDATKPVARPAIKPAAKPTAKPAGRKPRDMDDADPAGRVRHKPAAKAGAKPATRPGAKPALKSGPKSALRSGPKPASGATAKPPPRPAPARRGPGPKPPRKE